jgi:hypothetical protein
MTFSSCWATPGRFDERVLQLMAQHIDVPLALANLAARDKVSAAHIHITRHLPLEDASLNDLATMAAMSKQVMAIVNPQSRNKHA